MFSRIRSKLNSKGDGQHVLLHSFLAFAVRVAAAGTSFILTLVVTNSIGQEDSGLFFIALTLFNVFSLVFPLGLDMLLLKRVGMIKDPRELNAEVTTGFVSSLVVSSVVGALIIAFAEIIVDLVFHKPNLKVPLIYLMMAFPFQSAIQVVSSVLQSQKRTVLSIAVVKLITPALVVLVGSLFGVADVDYLALMYLLATLVSFAVSAKAVWKGLGSIPNLSKQFLKMTGQSRTFLTVIAFQQLYVWSGQFVVGVYLPAEDAAIFAVCRYTTMLLSFLLVAVNFVSAPEFAKLHGDHKHDELKKLFSYTNKMLLAVALPVSILVIVFSDFILGLFGSEYVNDVASQTLVILVLGQLINVVSGSSGYLLLMTDNERYYRNGVIQNGILAVLVSVILIPFLGVRGSAIATSLSLVFINFYSAYFVNRRLGIPALIFRK